MEKEKKELTPEERENRIQEIINSDWETIQFGFGPTDEEMMRIHKGIIARDQQDQLLKRPRHQNTV
jgi:hypothetical protein